MLRCEAQQRTPFHTHTLNSSVNTLTVLCTRSLGTHRFALIQSSISLISRMQRISGNSQHPLRPSTTSVTPGSFGCPTTRTPVGFQSYRTVPFLPWRPLPRVVPSPLPSQRAGAGSPLCSPQRDLPAAPRRPWPQEGRRAARQDGAPRQSPPILRSPSGDREESFGGGAGAGAARTQRALGKAVGRGAASLSRPGPSRPEEGAPAPRL